MPAAEIGWATPAVNRLVDRFGRAHTYLRISVTDRCNLRCTYCMPAEGIDWKRRDELLSNEEIIRIARVMVGMGIRKIRITGGEPLVRKNLDVLIAQLAGLEGIDTIAMTTNALLLRDQAAALKAAGLQALNISLDTLRPDRFRSITRRDDWHTVMAGIEAALEAGFAPLKLNAVIMAGVNEDELLDFVAFAQDKPINMRFIEYMPFKSTPWQPQDVLSWREMRRRIERQYTLIPMTCEPGAVGKDFQLAGHTGTVSFISSMTDSFCGTCNRLRLTAEGQLKSCLFHPAEINLRDALRRGIPDSRLETLISGAVWQKPEAHLPMEELLTLDNRPMIEIGG